MKKMMKKHELSNGLKIIELNRKSDIVTVQVTVNVGSNNESEKINGISHFIEHMVFEGTKNRSSEQIANEIESLGGEISAYTSHENTCFFVKITKQHVDKALEILSDIIINPKFDSKLIEKERKIILSEIKLVSDQPRHYQWILFLKALFSKFNAKNPISGTKKTVESLTKKEILDYYNKFYTSKNIIVTIVGDVKNVRGKIKKHFSSMNSSFVKTKFVLEKENKKSEKIETKQINQSYAVLGYKTAKRKDYDSYVLDVIRAVLGRGLSGKLFREIRIKYSLAYDVGIHHDPNIHYGIFAAYFSTNKKNISKCIKITLGEFKKLKKLSSLELNEAKQFIEGEYILDKEDSQSLADSISKWELSSDAKDCINYISKIRKVSQKDINRVVDKYLNGKYSLAIIKQKN
jgi:predicted Zn-dependent peptidase